MEAHVLSDLHEARLVVSRDAVLTPTAAAQVYGGRRVELIAAWRRAGVVYTDPTGRERVVWSDVIAWSRGERRSQIGGQDPDAPLWRQPTSAER